jgi:hypothetical protein
MLKFVPTYPTSVPSATGFVVNEPAIEVYNANGELLDLTVMQVTLTGSDFYNGMNFLRCDRARRSGCGRELGIHEPVVDLTSGRQRVSL